MRLYNSLACTFGCSLGQVRHLWRKVSSYSSIQFITKNIAIFYTLFAGFLFFYVSPDWVASMYVGVLCGTYTLPLYYFLRTEDVERENLSSTRLLMTGSIIGLVTSKGRALIWLVGYLMGIFVDVIQTQYEHDKEVRIAQKITQTQAQTNDDFSNEFTESAKLDEGTATELDEDTAAELDEDTEDTATELAEDTVAELDETTAELAKLAESSELAKLAKPAELAKLAESTKPAELAKLAESSELAKLAESSELAKLADLADLTKLDENLIISEVPITE